jgi:hypothetical protein
VADDSADRASASDDVIQRSVAKGLADIAHVALPIVGSGAAGYVARQVGLTAREYLHQKGETDRTRIIQAHQTAREAIRAEAEPNKPDNS